jgi:hypothetical protein
MRRWVDAPAVQGIAFREIARCIGRAPGRPTDISAAVAEGHYFEMR